MGYVVHHAKCAMGGRFAIYLHLLSRKKLDLGKQPRVLEPGCKHHWLYVWDTEAKALAFADELRKSTKDPAWEVMRVTEPDSEGPLSPVLLHLGRRGEGLHFSVHPLSMDMFKTAYPEAFPLSDIFIDADRWKDFRAHRGDMADFVTRIAPSLTDLSQEQLTELGYAVLDDQHDEIFVLVPPSEIVHA